MLVLIGRVKNVAVTANGNGRPFIAVRDEDRNATYCVAAKKGNAAASKAFNAVHKKAKEGDLITIENFYMYGEKWGSFYADSKATLG